MATVYPARDPKHDRKVELKVPVATAAAAPNAEPAIVFTASAASPIMLFFAMHISLTLYVLTASAMVYCPQWYVFDLRLRKRAAG